MRARSAAAPAGPPVGAGVLAVPRRRLVPGSPPRQAGEVLGPLAGLADRRGEAAALFNLATIDRRQGRMDRSRTRYADALDRYTELDIEEGRLDAVEGLAHLAALTGRYRRALLALLVCQRQRAQLGAPLFTPDERADRATAEGLARAGLSANEVADVVRDADATPLAEVAACLRAEPS